MKKVTTLAVKKSVQDARHLMRYLKAKANGGDLGSIAKAERVSVETVRQSVAKMEAFESMNGDGQLKLAVNGLVRTLIPTAGNTINGLLNATTIMSVKNSKTGQMEDILVEDKTTRLEAGRLVKDLISVTQPKAPTVAIQNNQNMPIATMSAAESNEERMKRLRKHAQDHNLLPAQVAAVPEYLDVKGADGDDEDDEGDEGEDGDED
jgi:hypothetical protein